MAKSSGVEQLFDNPGAAMGAVAAPDENAAPSNLDAFFFKDSIEVGVNKSIDVDAFNVRSFCPGL